MVEKHRNFVQAYLQCFDAAEAARRSQCGSFARIHVLKFPFI